MRFNRHLRLGLCGLLLAATAGCAAAYHDYPCGNISYGYCPPPPLPYTGFDTCPTPLAADYFSGGKTAAEGSNLALPAIPDAETP